MCRRRARARRVDARAEKPARAALFSAVQRSLAKEAIVIVDAMNYIKGSRYQMYCEAREVGVRTCTVRSGVPLSGYCRSSCCLVNCADKVKPPAPPSGLCRDSARSVPRTQRRSTRLVRLRSRDVRPPQGSVFSSEPETEKQSSPVPVGKLKLDGTLTWAGSTTSSRGSRNLNRLRGGTLRSLRSRPTIRRSMSLRRPLLKRKVGFRLARPRRNGYGPPSRKG